MTSLVSKLEHDGLIRRVADPADARAVLVTLTSNGHRYVRDRRQVGADVLRAAIGDLPDHHARLLRAALPALEAVAALAHAQTDTSSQRTIVSAETQR